MNPRRRTSATVGSGATSSSSSSPSSAILGASRSSVRSASNTSSVASAAAQASGLPVYVWPWKNVRYSRVLAEERVVHGLGRERRGERQVAAGDALGDAHQVGRDVLLLAGEHRARAAEADRDLVADQQHAELVAQLAHRPQVALRVHEHPGRALDERLDDHRGDPLAVRLEQPPHVGRVAGLGVVGLEQQPPERGVEQVDAADRHRADRVAVVGVAQADELGPLGSRPAAASTGRPSSPRPRPRWSRCRSRTPAPARAARSRRAAPRAAPRRGARGRASSSARRGRAASRTAASIAGWPWPWTVHHSDETPSRYALPSVSKSSVPSPRSIMTGASCSQPRCWVNGCQRWVRSRWASRRCPWAAR